MFDLHQYLKPASGCEPHELTIDEVTEKVILYLKGLVAYWDGLTLPDDDKIFGVIFSTFVLFDGESLLPRFMIKTPVNDQSEFCKQHGQHWIPADLELDLCSDLETDLYWHERWCDFRQDSSHLMADDILIAFHEEPRALTAEEVMELIFISVDEERRQIACMNAPIQSKLNQMIGMILNKLFFYQICSSPHEGDAKFHQEEGNCWYPVGMDIAKSLFERWNQETQ